MSIIEIKMALDSFFEIRFTYVGVIARVILAGIYLFFRMKLIKRGQKCAKSKMVFAIVLAIYVALLIGGTVFNRTPVGEYRIEFIPFWSYVQVFRERNLNLLRQMISNVLVFIPWPILFAEVFPHMKKFCWAVGSACLFSVFVELIQLVFRIGMFEFDDIFHNVLGAMIGYSIFMFYTKCSKKGIEV